MTTTTLLFLVLITLSTPIFASADPGFLGVNYGRIADNLPDPSKVVTLLKSQNINRIKIFDTDKSVLTALSGSDITITVQMPNELIRSAAANESFTDTWVKSNILPYYPLTKIEAIAIGNEVFLDDVNNVTEFLVPAMKNVYSSLIKQNINSSAIKLSSPLSFSAFQNSYPSSSCSFRTELIEPVIKPMLNFLKQADSYLMVNVYPYYAYAPNIDKISLDYALSNDNYSVTDPKNGLIYKSLFDAQLDASFTALTALNFSDMEIVVTEAGWPSKGDENEPGAGVKNAAAFNGNLVKRIFSGNGTPLKPNLPLKVFLFALFNENKKPGPTRERNYGLFYPNGEKVYDIPLSKEALKNWTAPVTTAPTPVTTAPTPVTTAPTPVTTAPVTTMPAPVTTAPAPVTTAPAPSSANGSKNQTEAPPGEEGVGDTWCVANGEVGREKLQVALDYACGEGEADCRPIQPGATCYDPDTLEAHASYAFNSYYQKNGRGPGTCDFGGTAHVVTQPPKFGNCKFPTKY